MSLENAEPSAPLITRRNPVWAREELILALELYLRKRSALPGAESEEVIALSKTLNQLSATTGALGTSTLRNPNGVAMKLGNFQRLDPDAAGRAGLTHGGRGEAVVWNEFADAPESLKQAAEGIRRALSTVRPATSPYKTDLSLHGGEDHLTLGDVVGSQTALMGVKAVWGVSEEPVMCFAAGATPSSRFSHAEAAARRAVSSPFLLTIGGGSHAPTSLQGRVLEVVRASLAYGETTAFVKDPELRAGLAQWPTAVVLLEVWDIVGHPHLVDDLGFPDRMVLAQAFDRVKVDAANTEALWERLRGWPARLRGNIPQISGFVDPPKPSLWGSHYPRIAWKQEEGRRRYRLAQTAERSSKAAKSAKFHNKLSNGAFMCEACGFSDEKSSLFDAHHLHPISLGWRESVLEDFAVLCPTCHRWAHEKADDRLSPLSVGEIQSGRTNLEHTRDF